MPDRASGLAGRRRSTVLRKRHLGTLGGTLTGALLLLSQHAIHAGHLFLAPSPHSCSPNSPVSALHLQPAQSSRRRRSFRYLVGRDTGQRRTRVDAAGVSRGWLGIALCCMLRSGVRFVCATMHIPHISGPKNHASYLLQAVWVRQCSWLRGRWAEGRGRAGGVSRCFPRMLRESKGIPGPSGAQTIDNSTVNSSSRPSKQLHLPEIFTPANQAAGEHPEQGRGHSLPTTSQLEDTPLGAG